MTFPIPTTDSGHVKFGGDWKKDNSYELKCFFKKYIKIIFFLFLKTIFISAHQNNLKI